MRRPTPSMIVSIIALVMASAGTSVAAINFAKNAGAVDGKSAVSATASNGRAAGKLVATGKSGRVPIRFLDLAGIMRGEKQTFAQGIEVVDNANGAAVALSGREGLGVLTASCNDQANAAGNEDPATTITFTNGSGQPVNYSRTVGAGNPTVTVVPAAAQESFTINNSNTFDVYVALGTAHYVVRGNARQDGRATAAASCAVWGYALNL